MRSNFQLLVLLCSIAVTIHAQNEQSPSLNLGDPAPLLKVREWIKGTPIQKFEKGKVYVVEFWATWCRPCIAGMPHLSALAREYKERVTILSIDILETKTTSMGKIKAFVDSMGQRMDYNVAADDSNFMVAGWLDASGIQGVPWSFVVNAEGTLAWIGPPQELDEVLPKIVNNAWDIKEASAKRELDKHLRELDMEAYYELFRYRGKHENLGDIVKPDSALVMINKIVKNEPKLKYAPFIAYSTFASLLKTNLHKAYEYGKVVLVTSTYEEPNCYAIIDPITLYSDKLNLSAEIYQLGAEACQTRIEQIPYPELVNIPKLYNKMAVWYWRAKDKSKAIDAQQKGIKALKSRIGFSKTEMAAFESRLQQYKNK